MSFEFNSNIPDDVVQKMQEYFFHTIDWQDVANEVSNYIEADDIIGNVSRSVLEELVNDHIDYDRIVDEVSSQISGQVEDQVRLELSDYDLTGYVNDAVESLLYEYDPHNGCSIGKKFTLIVEAAMLFLMQERKDFVNEMKSILNEENTTVIAENEPVEQEIVPLFNPDLIGINEVVAKIADRYLVTQQENPQFLINLQMEMWQVFINTRSSYISSVKNSKIEPNDD